MKVRLHPGESVQLGDFSVELKDVSIAGETAVFLSIQEKEGRTSSFVLKRGEPLLLKDDRGICRLKIEMEGAAKADLASNLSWATINLKLKARPDLSLILVPDKDIYNCGETINIGLLAENRGAENAENICLYILDFNIDDSYARESKNSTKLKEMRICKSILRPAELWKRDIKLKAPCIPETKDAGLLVRAEYFDPDGNKYEAISATTIRISGPVQLHKYVEEIQKFGRKYYVIITIRNTGDKRLNLSLEDSAGDNFQADRLSDRFELGPGESRIFSYVIKAKRPGEEQILPAAKCTYFADGFKYEVLSESPVVDVFGPCIEARRYAEELSARDTERSIRIFMEIKNSGNRYAAIHGYNLIPEDIDLLEGERSLRFGLAPGESKCVSWSLRSPNESFKLPPISLRYFDSENNMFTLEVPVLQLETGNTPSNQSAETLSVAANQNVDVNEIRDQQLENKDVDGNRAKDASVALVMTILAALIWIRSL